MRLFYKTGKDSVKGELLQEQLELAMEFDPACVVRVRLDYDGCYYEGEYPEAVIEIYIHE